MQTHLLLCSISIPTVTTLLNQPAQSEVVSPIYTAEKFWHGSDEKSAHTEKIGPARIDFVVLTTSPHPCWAKLSPVLGSCREVVRARIKLVRNPEKLAQLG